MKMIILQFILLTLLSKIEIRTTSRIHRKSKQKLFSTRLDKNEKSLIILTEQNSFLQKSQNLNKIQSKFGKMKNDDDIPKSYTINYRTLFDVEVQDQGSSCNSGWSFSLAGAVEAAYRQRNRKYTTYLSPQTLLDCVKKDNNGCQGGHPLPSLKYMKKKGIGFEFEYPYQEKQSSCRFKKKKPKAKITSFDFCSNTDTISSIPQSSGFSQKICTLKTWQELLSKGPVAVYIDSSSDTFQNYHGGIIDPNSLNCKKPNHMMLAIGWGSFWGKEYIVLRNSYGPYWGEQGYMRIKYDAKANETCFVTAAAYLPIL
jgi:cathepsin L